LPGLFCFLALALLARPGASRYNKSGKRQKPHALPAKAPFWGIKTAAQPEVDKVNVQGDRILRPALICSGHQNEGGNLPMTFGEKLFKLRKEKGLSQEQLAEQMNTTRQAVSKWENDQGFPETEKLMMLGNIFSVSIDYLLKNSGEADGPAAGGYYVSREKAQSWLSHESRFARNLCLSISCLVCSGIPYFLLGSTSAGVLGCVVVAVLGLCGVLVTCLTDRDYEYRPLKQNALLFDQAFLQELSSRYARLKKWYVAMAAGFFALVLVGGTVCGLALDQGAVAEHVAVPALLPIVALGLSMLLYALSMMDAYELLVYNEEHINKLSTRFLNRMRGIGRRHLP